jgi:hypothetical protein
MTKIPGRNKAGLYRFIVDGTLDSKWADWFWGLDLEPVGENRTALTGPVADQSALHGILAKIRDLGLPLVSIQLLEEEKCRNSK